MGRPARWITALTGRPAMRSPGRPPIRRGVEREFWVRIAEGMSSEEAGIACGVSGVVGSRWFRESGGMPALGLGPDSGRYLSFAEREEIALLRAQDVGVREIARQLGRSPSTISRELRRNAATRGARLDYRASIAQWKAELAARRPKIPKLVADERLRGYVQDRLSGEVQLPDGSTVFGPQTPRWNGRNKPRREDRRWVTAWSPQQIANRLPVDFRDDDSMRISHEAIYQALYIQGRRALDRELVTCLRTGRALRAPRARSRQRAVGHVTPETVIAQRPAEADGRAVAGHWEGDLIIGTNQSAIGTLVERTTRFTMLLHLPRLEGYGVEQRVKNGPALAGHGAGAVRNAIATAFAAMPEHVRRSLTWDRGKELAQHVQLSAATGMKVVLRGPAQPLAARHQREHERAAATVLPERNGSVPMDRRRNQCGRRYPQRQASQDPRLADTCRSPR